MITVDGIHFSFCANAWSCLFGIVDVQRYIYVQLLCVFILRQRYLRSVYVINDDGIKMNARELAYNPLPTPRRSELHPRLVIWCLHVNYISEVMCVFN